MSVNLLFAESDSPEHVDCQPHVIHEDQKEQEEESVDHVSELLLDLLLSLEHILIHFFFCLHGPGNKSLDVKKENHVDERQTAVDNVDGLLAVELRVYAGHL